MYGSRNKNNDINQNLTRSLFLCMFGFCYLFLSFEEPALFEIKMVRNYWD